MPMVMGGHNATDLPSTPDVLTSKTPRFNWARFFKKLDCAMLSVEYRCLFPDYFGNGTVLYSAIEP